MVKRGPSLVKIWYELSDRYLMGASTYMLNSSTFSKQAMFLVVDLDSMLIFSAYFSFFSNATTVLFRSLPRLLLGGEPRIVCPMQRGDQQVKVMEHLPSGWRGCIMREGPLV